MIAAQVAAIPSAAFAWGRGGLPSALRAPSALTQTARSTRFAGGAEQRGGLSSVALGAAALGAAALGRAVRPRQVRRGRAAAAGEPSVVAVATPADAGFGVKPEDLVAHVPIHSTRVGRKTGVLLLNIGTPASTTVEDVRDYLSRFLADDRVLEVKPKLLKSLLLQVVLATRPKGSAENYAKIWDAERGSPLQYHSEDLAKALQKELGEECIVRIGFSYSEPFVSDALKSFALAGVDEVLLVPMFPHYASSTTGSVLASAYSSAAEAYCTPYLRTVPPFFNHPAYLRAMKETVTADIGPGGKNVDHVLFSFHGIPEAQCTQTDDTEKVCLKRQNCCAEISTANRNCYRAQCFESARLLAAELGLPPDRWTIGFQSRLTLRGTIQWIRPYTDEALADLARQGKTRLAVLAPSFTADCVETLEELGITGREEFAEAGGKELVVVPCLNSSGAWVKSLAEILREQLAGQASTPTGR